MPLFESSSSIQILNRLMTVITFLIDKIIVLDITLQNKLIKTNKKMFVFLACFYIL